MILAYNEYLEVVSSQRREDHQYGILKEKTLCYQMLQKHLYVLGLRVLGSRGTLGYS